MVKKINVLLFIGFWEEGMLDFVPVKLTFDLVLVKPNQFCFSIVFCLRAH